MTDNDLARTKKHSIGFNCFNCRTNLDTKFSDWRKAEIYAGELGWCIGHLDGQGMISCPDCKNAMWDASTLDRLHKP